MNYIKNDERCGIDYDLKVIKKEYEKLKIPREYDFIKDDILSNIKWNIYLSERSLGKTTNLILLGMVFNKIYGTQIQYIRLKESEIKASIVSELMSTIVKYNNGFYLKQLTDGKYTSVRYHWRKLYFCNYDKNGKVIDQEEEPFLQFLSIDNNLQYKSGYNAPLGDFIICDEFVGKQGFNDTFVQFCDLLKTIIRDRLSPKIFLCANTIDYNATWFRELTIDKTVKSMRVGQSKIVNTSLGMPIKLSILGTSNKSIKNKHNSLFFGFNNPKLASITGSDTWAFENVPHIFKDAKELIFRNVYINYYDELLQIECYSSKRLGIILEIHPATTTHEDSIVYTTTDLSTKNERFYFSINDKIDSFINQMYKENRCYFSDNATGDVFKNFIQEAKKRG